MHNILIHYFSLYIHTATQVLIGSQNDEVFDSTASPIDLDEASKRCVLAEKFHLTHFKSFQSEIMDCLPHFLLGHKSLAELDVMAINHLPTFFTLIMTFTMLVSGHVVWLNSSALIILMM